MPLFSPKLLENAIYYESSYKFNVFVSGVVWYKIYYENKNPIIIRFSSYDQANEMEEFLQDYFAGLWQ